MARKFDRSVQRMRVGLTLSRSEVDTLEAIFQQDYSEMADHIRVMIRKARQFAGDIK